MIEEFHVVYGAVMSRELEDLNTGVENEPASITYAIAHWTSFACCSNAPAGQGTRYAELINEVFYPGYQAVSDCYAGRPVEPTLVKLILIIMAGKYKLMTNGGSYRHMVQLQEQLQSWNREASV